MGYIARVMKNFQVDDLVLVRPAPLGGEARRRAMGGLELLERARTVEDFNAGVRGVDLLVGTSGVETKSERRFARIATSPRDLAQKVARFPGTVGLAFGREDDGLHEDELSKCDLLAAIPASPGYPILNISHAAAILLYELFVAGATKEGPRAASGLEKEKLHAAFRNLLVAADYPVHKVQRTRIMFRRMIGRAVPSKWEFHAMMGVFARATKRIQRLEARAPLIREEKPT